MKFHTIQDLADLLKVNHKTIRRAIDKGQLFAVQIGSVYRISQADVDAYLDTRKTQPPAREREVKASRRKARVTGKDWFA